MNFSSKQMAELNACWNSLYRKIVGFNRWESVKALIHGLERLDFHHIVSLRKARFYRRLVFHQSRLFKDLFWCYFFDYFCKDSDLLYIFKVILQLWTWCILIFMLFSPRTLYICWVFLLYVFILTFLILCLSICLSRFSYYSDVIGCALYLCNMYVLFICFI